MPSLAEVIAKTKREIEMITVTLPNGAKIELTVKQYLKSNLPAMA